MKRDNTRQPQATAVLVTIPRPLIEELGKLIGTFLADREHHLEKLSRAPEECPPRHTMPLKRIHGAK